MRQVLQVDDGVARQKTAALPSPPQRPRWASCRRRRGAQGGEGGGGLCAAAERDCGGGGRAIRGHTTPCGAGTPNDRSVHVVCVPVGACHEGRSLSASQSTASGGESPVSAQEFVIVFLVQTWVGGQSPLTERYSRELSGSGIGVVQCDEPRVVADVTQRWGELGQVLALRGHCVHTAHAEAGILTQVTRLVVTALFPRNPFRKNEQSKNI